jgi:segregation and condensation protein A
LAQRVPITVRLENFEGPLDLLLYLIQTQELGISRVSISKITDQYLTYVRIMQELNFDAASEFLVMAATLLHWKSKALLPQDKAENQASAEEDGLLTQEELVRQLLEHQRFLEAGQNLAQLPHLGLDVFTRANSKPPVQRIWKEMNISDLVMTYQDILVRARNRTRVLRKETVSISDKIMEFSTRLTPHQVVEIRTLMADLPSRQEIVATFLATLELGRLKKMRLFQEEAYSNIFIELLESLIGFDSQQASGFDAVIAHTEAAIAAQHAANSEPAHLTG